MKKIGILLAALLLAGCQQTVQLNSDQVAVVNNAGGYFAASDNATFVSCTTQDSEPDGYVTCTIKDKTTGALTLILCSYQSVVGGCKPK